MEEQITIRQEENNALIIIDPQMDFVDENGALYVAGVPGENDNATIIRLIKRIDQLPWKHRAVTKDQHPENHIEFPDYGVHCWAGRQGESFQPDLQFFIEKAEVYCKGTDPDIVALSIGNGVQFGDHVRKLRAEKIKKVFLCGWAYTHCVGESAIDYAKQNFEVFIVRDCTNSVITPFRDVETMDQKLELYNVKLITSDQLV